MIDEQIELPLDVSVTLKDLDALNKEIFDQREKIDEMNDLVKTENKKLALMETKLVEVLKEHDRTNYKSPYGTISIVDRYSYRIPQSPQEKEEFFNYLRELGEFDKLVSVNSMTLNSFCKEQQKIADEEGRGFDFKIPGILPPTLQQSISVRKGK